MSYDVDIIKENKKGNMSIYLYQLIFNEDGYYPTNRYGVEVHNMGKKGLTTIKKKEIYGPYSKVVPKLLIVYNKWNKKYLKVKGGSK